MLRGNFLGDVAIIAVTPVEYISYIAAPNGARCLMTDISDVLCFHLYLPHRKGLQKSLSQNTIFIHKSVKRTAIVGGNSSKTLRSSVKVFCVKHGPVGNTRLLRRVFPTDVAIEMF